MIVWSLMLVLNSHYTTGQSDSDKTVYIEVNAFFEEMVRTNFCYMHIYIFMPFIIFVRIFSLPIFSLPTQIRGHIYSPIHSPLPTTYSSCLSFWSREDVSPFFSGRLASNCVYPRYRYRRSQRLTLFIFAYKFKILLRTYSWIPTPGPMLWT